MTPYITPLQAAKHLKSLLNHHFHPLTFTVKSDAHNIHVTPINFNLSYPQHEALHRVLVIYAGIKHERHTLVPFVAPRFIHGHACHLAVKHVFLHTAFGEAVPEDQFQSSLRTFSSDPELPSAIQRIS